MEIPVVAYGGKQKSLLLLLLLLLLGGGRSVTERSKPTSLIMTSVSSSCANLSRARYGEFLLDNVVCVALCRWGSNLLVVW